MSLTLESEESLGTGLEKQVARLSDLEASVCPEATLGKPRESADDQITGLKQSLPSLKRQCERYKTERASLQTEIASLRSERDTLRLEVKDGHEQHAAVEEHLLTDVDGQGRANRRIWLLEQRNADLRRELASAQSEHEDAIERERNVSHGLRERIGTLDEKRRRAQEEASEAKSRAASLQAEVDALRAAQGHVQQTSQSREEKDRPVLATSEPGQIASPRRALSKRSSNVALFMPITPIKSQKTPATTPHPLSTGKGRPRATSLSPASITKRYAALEDRHKVLKAEYDRLRSKYQDDIKHWKDWKALDTARKEEKRKRKEQRHGRATGIAGDLPVSAGVEQKEPEAGGADDEVVTLVPPSQGSPSSSRPSASQEQPGSQRVTRSQARKRKAEGGSQASQPHADAVIELAPEATVVEPPAPILEVTPMPPPSQKRRPLREDRETRDDTPTPAGPPVRTPGTASDTRKRATPAARITPWLGSGARIRGTAALTTRHDVDPFDADDPNREPSPLKRYPSNAGESSRAPLVRDRGEGPASSLRRAALTRTFSTDLAALVAVRERDSVSPGPESSAVKRRRLDMEGLSPAEKAQERKRLNKMTPAERRAEYADYKGKGRYLPPDEVQKRVTDDYEIDPKQNAGVAYQYHDVRRGRSERKQMHGGDCECCSGYYEAVGPIPKYNPAPAWKDPSQRDSGGEHGDEQDLTEAQVREHQNKVSRHRETWKRPPTPPGYWAIGFPNTQDVEEQNKKADVMVKEKEAQIRREAAHRDSKWKKKA